MLFPGIIHFIGAVAFHIIRKSGKEPLDVSDSDRNRQRSGGFWESFDEFRTCHEQAKRTIKVEKPSFTTVALNNVTQFLILLHLLVGTIIFSSCQFLRLFDAIPVIGRYAISTLVCRFISVYELRGMSDKLEVGFPDSSVQDESISIKGRCPIGKCGLDSQEQRPRPESTGGDVSKPIANQSSQYTVLQRLGR